MHNPAHAGMLISEWLEGLQENGTPVSITQLAERIQITRAILSRITHGKATLTADVALRLDRGGFGYKCRLVIACSSAA